MIQTDFYTGEPVQTGSPPSFSNNEVEAAELASFGKYSYAPGDRMANQSNIYPGAYGYNPYQQPQQAFGIGAPPPHPMYYNTQYSPYGNVQPSYNNYRTGYGYNNPYYQQQQYEQPKTVHISGSKITGEYLPPMDWEDRISEMEREYWCRVQETDAKQSVDRNNSPYGYGYNYCNNYYGMPFYNPYQYNSLNNEYSQKINALLEEARDNRIKFNFQISRLAHNFCKYNISDEALMERYTGKDIEIPEAYKPDPIMFYDQSRFINAVPFDNSALYRQHRQQVQDEYNKVIPKDADMKTCFKNMGILAANWELEEEKHRRRNAGNLYDKDAYKYFVRKKAQERYAKEKGIFMPGSNIADTMQNYRQAIINSSPILSQNTYLADDGTLNVSLNLPCNVGSHAGENYSVHNSQEAEYESKRERFAQFLNAIPSNIALDEIKQKKIEEYSYG